MGEIRVVLVEDHDLSRIGLSAALQQEKEIKVVGEAANGQQGLSLISQLKPDVALVDIGLPDIDGIELTQQLKKSAEDSPFSEVRILILTMHKTEDSVLAAFAAGADSYALKDINLKDLVQAIQLTKEGNAWIDPAIARIVLKQARQPEELSTVAASGEGRHTIEIESLDPDAQKLLANLSIN